MHTHANALPISTIHHEYSLSLRDANDQREWLRVFHTQSERPSDKDREIGLDVDSVVVTIVQILWFPREGEETRKARIKWSKNERKKEKINFI